MSLGALLSALSRFRGLPPEPRYPLPEGTTPPDWIVAVAGALHRLAEDPSAGERALALDRLAAAPFADGVEKDIGRVRLVGDTVLILDNPARINQGLKDTCAVTSIESWLAQHEPAEYARLVEGLVSPAGTVLLRGGATLRRDEQVFLWSAQEGRRSPVSRILQAALMEAATPTLDYRNSRAGHLDASGQIVSGLDLLESDSLLESIFAEEWSVFRPAEARLAAMFGHKGVPRLPEDIPLVLAHAAARGRPVFAVLNVPPHPSLTGHAALPHKVRLLDVDADWVVYEDPLDPAEPWMPQVRTEVISGYGRCRIAAADFARILEAVSFPAGFTR